MMPRSACRPATNWATVSQTQKPLPGSDLRRIHVKSPQIQPTLNTATTTKPTNLWTSGTPGYYVPLGPV